jgi:BON domain-containing protein
MEGASEVNTQLRRQGNLLLAGLFALALIFGCAAKPNDAQLATNLKAQMFSDSQTNGANLQVAVKDGVVTLSGSVPSDAARLEAYKIATNTPGVSKVNDQMNVQAPQQTAQAASPSTSDATSAATAVQPPAMAKPPHETKAERKRRLRAERAERLKQERQQRAQQQAQADSANQAASNQPPASTPAAQAPPANPPDTSQGAQTQAPPPPPVDAVFPEGTTVEIQTIDPIDSKTAQAGDEFQATLAQPLTWNSRVIAPAGANVYLRLVQAQTSGQYKGTSELQLELARLELNGAQYQMHSSTYTVAGGSRGKDTAKTVGGGAIVGAIIGAIAGGGKGAVIGGAAGAGAGGVYQGVTKAKQVRIPAETKLDFKLDKALKIPVAPDSGAQ